MNAFQALVVETETRIAALTGLVTALRAVADLFEAPAFLPAETIAPIPETTPAKRETKGRRPATKHAKRATKPAIRAAVKAANPKAVERRPGVVAFLTGKAPQSKADILAHVEGCSAYTLTQLVRNGRVAATGATSQRRYSLPSPKPAASKPATKPEFDTVWDGRKGSAPLSSHMTKMS